MVYIQNFKLTTMKALARSRGVDMKSEMNNPELSKY